MATGDSIFTLTPAMSGPVSANYATPGFVADASTPNTLTPVLEFDGTTNEHADFRVVTPSQYDGGGLKFAYQYATDGADADLVELEFRVVKLSDLDVLTSDLALDGATAVAIQDTPPATPTNKFSVSTTGNLTHANAGSPTKHSTLIIRVTRDTAAATNTDDLLLVSVAVEEV